ncbi:MAG: hypothetical protein SFH39_00590 [Candidatus Magnetobacterium sp. LHC-1]
MSHNIREFVTWLAKIGVAFIFFVILFPLIAVIIPFPETGEFTVAEIVIEGGILALMIAGLHIFLKWFNLTLRHSSCNNKQTSMTCQNGRINRGGSHMGKLGKILQTAIGITIGLMNSRQKNVLWSIVFAFLFYLNFALAVLIVYSMPGLYQKAIFYLMEVRSPIDFIGVFIWVTPAFALWKLRRKLREVWKESAIATITIAVCIAALVYFNNPLLYLITGWIYYISHIAENIRFNVTEIVSSVFILVLLIVGLHLFIKWIWLRRFRTVTPTVWPLRKTFVPVAIFIIMFIAGISTTVSINQLSGIANAPIKLIRMANMANQTVSDLRHYMWLYANEQPYIIVTDRAGNEGCIESNKARNKRTCQAKYNKVALATYTSSLNGMNEVLGNFINHYTNKGDKSPYTGQPLLVTTHTREGEIVLTPTNSSTVSITAYAEDMVVPIFSAVLEVRDY